MGPQRISREQWVRIADALKRAGQALQLHQSGVAGSRNAALGELDRVRKELVGLRAERDPAARNAIEHIDRLLEIARQRTAHNELNRIAALVSDAESDASGAERTARVIAARSGLAAMLSDHPTIADAGVAERVEEIAADLAPLEAVETARAKERASRALQLFQMTWIGEERAEHLLEIEQAHAELVALLANRDDPSARAVANQAAVVIEVERNPLRAAGAKARRAASN